MSLSLDTIHDMECEIEGCTKQIRAKNPRTEFMCNEHRRRKSLLGDPLAGGKKRYRYASLEDEFIAKTEMSEHGLIWTGAINYGGYGIMSGNRQRCTAHRYAWERANYELPPRSEAIWSVDHLPECPKNCVDARHLTAMTQSDHCKLEWQRGKMRSGRWHGRRNGDYYQN